MNVSWVPEGFWAGTVKSLYDVIEKSRLLQGAEKIDTSLLSFDDDGDDGNPLLSVLGPVAVVNISGSLTSQDSPLNFLFGITSYQTIRDAVIEAANDDSVKEIVLNIDSPGGSANGAFELSRFIKEIDSKVKPVRAFTGGLMASAAYLIGSSARELVASPTATVGSIGVISVHKEVTKMLEDTGVNVTVVRSGKYKALANPYEELSAEAKAELQAQSDELYNEFISVVAENRNVTTVVADQQMGQGREFLGRKALSIGLVDKLGDIDTLIADLVAKYAVAARSKAPGGHNFSSSIGNEETGEPNMPRKKAKTLSPELQAQLASGVPLGELECDDEVDTSESELNQQAGGTDVPSAEGDATPGAESTPELNADNDKEETQSAPQKDLSGVVEFLKSELSAAQDKLTNLSLELAKAKAALEDYKATVPALEEIVRTAMVRMEIGMGNGQASYEHLSGAELIAQHAKVTSKFEERFPVGGKAKVSAPKSGDKTIDGKHQAFLGAASI
jgi:signal peptide peptidase SppA